MSIVHMPGARQEHARGYVVWPACGAVGKVAGDGEESNCPECSAMQVESALKHEVDDATCPHCRMPYLDCLCGEIFL